MLYGVVLPKHQRLTAHSKLLTTQTINKVKPTLNHCGIQGSCRDSRHQENNNMMTQDELDVWVNELLEQNNDS